MAEILPEDSGVIRCICEYDHDDNFTIQCERCNAWQHAKCVSITDENAVPDNYLCPDCSGGSTLKLSRERARAVQRDFLAQRQALQLPLQAPTVEEEREERRRRGRKRPESEVVEKPQIEEPAEFNPRFYVIHISKTSLTPAARLAWQKAAENVPLLLPKDVKGLPQLNVARSKSSGPWAFGVTGGAVTTETNIAPNKYICEVVGNAMLRSEYASEPTNQFWKLGCPKPGAVFVPGLPLAIDCRRRGSIFPLFISRSSDPNAKLVARKDGKGELRVFVVSRKQIKAGTEVCLGWHWPAHHPLGKTASDRETNGVSIEEKEILWLLNTDLESCKPTTDVSDEDWGLAPKDEDEVRGLESPMPVATARKHKRAEELLNKMKTISGEGDSGVALEMHVWIPAAQGAIPPPKKRMSLKDYMRKRS